MKNEYISSVQKSIYDFLVLSESKDVRTAFDIIYNKLDTQKQYYVSEFIVNNKVISNLHATKNANGSYIFQISQNSYLTYAGLKYISLYRKYHKKKDLDIELLMNDANEMILYQRKLLQIDRFIKVIIGFVCIFVGAIMNQYDYFGCEFLRLFFEYFFQHY